MTSPDTQERLRDLETRVSQARSALNYLERELDEARADAQHAEIEELELHLADTEHKLDNLRDAAGDAWLEVKHAVDAGWVRITAWFDAGRK